MKELKNLQNKALRQKKWFFFSLSPFIAIIEKWKKMMF